MKIETYFMAAGRTSFGEGISEKAQREIRKNAFDLRNSLGESAIILSASNRGGTRTARLVLETLFIKDYYPSSALDYFGNHPEEIHPLTLPQLIGREIGRSRIDEDRLGQNPLLIITHAPLMRAAKGNVSSLFPEGSVFKYEGLWAPPPPSPIVPIEL